MGLESKSIHQHTNIMRVLLFTITLSILFSEHECNHGRFTPLDTDNHPCKAENLKLTNRYLCSSEGEVYCQTGVCEGPEECVCFSGWEGNACDRCQPLPGCSNGDCVDHPNTCECNSGWTGHLCDQPECNNGLGCEHVTCVQ